MTAATREREPTVSRYQHDSTLACLRRIQLIVAASVLPLGVMYHAPYGESGRDQIDLWQDPETGHDRAWSGAANPIVYWRSLTAYLNEHRGGLLGPAGIAAVSALLGPDRVVWTCLKCGAVAIEDRAHSAGCVRLAVQTLIIESPDESGDIDV